MIHVPHPDSQFQSYHYHLSEVRHHYGPKVHLLANPFLLSHLAQLCALETQQPVINQLITTLYASLLQIVVNQEFPRKQAQVKTRMVTTHSEAVFQGPIIDPEIPVVTVNLARAGTLPSHICYTALNYFMNPQKVRQDHISIGRVTNECQKVTGAQVCGHKIGGDIDHSIVLFPDPMGATGETLSQALKLYRPLGQALSTIAIHCIVTPEYLKRMQQEHPSLTIYAIRVDRGLSAPAILDTPLGTHWDEEKGLNHHDYIIPGGGGFGEILNNAYV